MPVSMPKPAARALVIALIAGLLSGLLGGCAEFAYYAQAVGGQAALLQAARPIPEVLADPALDPGLRTRLTQAQAIRDFASRELALPDNGSYQRYADLGRPYVVWNVFAAPEFSLDLEKWCFIVVGCVPYRGYYRQADAEDFAQTLSERGLDTYVAGIAAYSTLGFFADPVLNTFLRLGDERAARTIFHELAHQRLYVKGDPAFSESFAVAVEYEGLRRWFMRTGDAAALRRLELRQQRQRAFDAAAEASRARLRELYAASLDTGEKRRRKAAIMAEITAKLERRATARGFTPQRREATQLPTQTPIQTPTQLPAFNNALLGSLGLYRRWVPAFGALLRAADGDLPTFYRQAAALAGLPASEREAALARLLAAEEP